MFGPRRELRRLLLALLRRGVDGLLRRLAVGLVAREVRVELLLEANLEVQGASVLD